MTRHTTEFLRQRSSNLSLRMAATANAAVTPPKASSQAAEVSMSESRKACVIGDLDDEHLSMCLECFDDLSDNALPRSYRIVGANECSICSVKGLKAEAFTKGFCKFLENNPTIFHAVDYFKSKMVALGFQELPARDDWSGKLEAGGKYFVTRNGSSVIAFTVGKAYKPGNGVAMIAGHIDALTAKLKPVSDKPKKAGYIELGVAQYAGALNETWWDRDLSIGGRVIIRDDSGKTTSKLVKLGWPIAKIPSLAPHFGVGMTGAQNKETQVVPVIGLDNSDLYSSSKTKVESVGPAGSFVAKQPPKLVKLISSELGIKDYSQIVNWELELFDFQPATVCGVDKEFITAGRIDDKLCSWGAFEGLLASEMGENEGTIKMVALFDDEEIGSLLRQGAKGNFLPLVIERAVEALCEDTKTSFGPGVMGRTYARSFLVSADVTHAVNPNFLSKYLDDHAPRLNVGIVICADSNGHMTTDAVSTAILTRVCELSDCTPQVFQIRNDSRSGGTVGPTLSSMMGVKAADAGMPQLSMHSIRATTGSLDPGLGVKFFKGFLDNWEKIDNEWSH